ncbi:hypothetical protein PG995_007645 [Apiospora arundinis]
MANRYSTRVYAVHATVRDQARLMHRMHLFDRKSFCLGTFGALLLPPFPRVFAARWYITRQRRVPRRWFIKDSSLWDEALFRA